jgi:ParB family chromosome partitioning protein
MQTKLTTTKIQVLLASESVEWYTPPRYVSAVRRVLGRIELDPASCEAANRIVQAERILTIESDGLSQSWEAQTVFLNPPYSRRAGKSNQSLWSKKLVDEFGAGRIRRAAILLVTAATGQKWFQPLFDHPICFTNHRIHFDNVDTHKHPTIGSAFIYFGSERDLFAQEFAEIGTVISRLDFNET